MSQPKVWLITGTSTGLGRALAELALEKGDTVVATLRKPPALAPLTAAYPPSRLLALALDVTRPDEVAAAFAQAVRAFGRVDIVVNNAGYGDLGEVEGMPDADARAIFETNFWGAVAVTREALRVFREVNPPGEGGRLLQISSMMGHVGHPAIGFYVASKFALEGITASLVKELDPKWNIKVTLIEPGWFRTSVVTTATWMPRHPAYEDPALPTNQLRAAWAAFVPAGDTRKGVEVFYRVAGLPDPPLHFPVGKDAIAEIGGKVRILEETIEKYGGWSEGLEAVD
ncbi:NAD(P)-binding protein [Trametes meyenii]|nr:NAD(P)-binding protein [Trametes meyenii]